MPIKNRVGFYERINRARVVSLNRFPFYMVQCGGFPGKMFEPVDCLNQVAGVKQYKEANAERELDGIAKITACEQSGVTLHKFDSWGYPQ